MSLDEKIEKCYGDITAIRVVHVKQSIKELKHMIEFECTPLPNAKDISNRLNSQIDIIFGPGLI